MLLKTLSGTNSKDKNQNFEKTFAKLNLKDYCKKDSVATICVIKGHPPKKKSVRLVQKGNDVTIISGMRVITFPDGQAEKVTYQMVRSDASLSKPKPVKIKFNKDKKTFTVSFSGFRKKEVWTFEILT